MTASADYRKLANRYRTLPEQVVRAGAKPMREAILAELAGYIGGDLLMSGFTRRKGVTHQKMGVTVKVNNGRTFYEAEVRPGPKRFGGMWSIIEYGTRERVAGRLPRKTTGPGGKHMAIGGGEQWHTGPWSTGRSPATNTFANGSKAGTPAAERAMAQEWEKANG